MQDFKKALIQADLTPSQAEILDYLYQHKDAKASEIASKIGRSRAIVYKELEELVKIGILEKTERPNQVAVFSANHPSLLTKLLEERENQLKKDRELLNSYLPDMVSSYNLIQNKPGVRFFEGEDGIKKVLEDSLTSKSTIMTFADIEAIVRYIKEINENYVAKRDKLGIKKQAILVDSKFGRDYLQNYHRATTDMKFFDHKLFPFQSVMQVYDGKTSYITLNDNNMIGIIIEDQAIFQMNKSIFEHAWATALTFDQLPPFSNAQ